MTEFNKRLVLKAAPLWILSLAIFLAFVLRADATVVTGLRIGNNTDYVRLVLEFDRPLVTPPSLSLLRDTMRITLAGIVNQVSPPGGEEYSDGIVNLDISRLTDATQIDAVFAFEPADIKTFSLTGPHRFIVDAYRPAAPAAAVSRPVKEADRIPSVDDHPSSPEPYIEPGQPSPSGISGAVAQAAMNATGSESPAGSDAGDVDRNRFQQILITALIGVTSIILVLLFFLIWMGSTNQNTREPSWIDHLPPTTDPTVENIDAVIRKLLKCDDYNKAAGQVYSCPSKK
jgi:hypothetical protein